MMASGLTACQPKGMETYRLSLGTIRCQKRRGSAQVSVRTAVHPFTPFLANCRYLPLSHPFTGWTALVVMSESPIPLDFCRLTTLIVCRATSHDRTLLIRVTIEEGWRCIDAKGSVAQVCTLGYVYDDGIDEHFMSMKARVHARLQNRIILE
jgi:hypothetical protein